MAAGVVSVITGTSLYLQKKKSDGTTSSFVAMTNPFPSYSLTHADGEMDSFESWSISLLLSLQTS